IGFSVLTLLVTLHSSALGEPMSVFGADKYRSRFRSYFGLVLGAHFAVTVAAAAVIALVAVIVGSTESSGIERTLLALAIATPFALLVWLLRRALYTRLQTRWSAVGGAVYAVLLVASIVVLHELGHLSAPTAFLAVGACSLLVSVCLLWL